MKDQYVKAKKGVFFHYYGDDIYLCRGNKDIIALDKIDKAIACMLETSSNIKDLKNNFCKYNNFDSNIVDGVIDRFLDKYKNYLTISDNKNKIIFTGECGKCYPIQLIISLTNKCGLKCIHCFKGEVTKAYSLDYEKLKTFLDKVIGKIRIIVFSGGEAFTYSNIVKLTSEYNKYFRIWISTSGFVVDCEKMISVAQIVDGMQFSLYGASPLEHDLFTGVSGSFQITMNNIVQASKYCKISISSVLRNDVDWDSFASFCKKNNILSVTLTNVIGIGRGEKYLDNEKELDINQILAKFKYYDVNVICNYSQCKSYLCNEEKCYAGKLLLTLTEEGKIISCPFLKNNELGIDFVDNNWKVS